MLFVIFRIYKFEGRYNRANLDDCEDENGNNGGYTNKINVSLVIFSNFRVTHQ